MPGDNVLQTLQKYATVVHRLDDIAEKLADLRKTLTDRLDRQDSQIMDLRERVTRLEATRDADRAQSQADLARFMAEVERAEMRLMRLLPKKEESTD